MKPIDGLPAAHTVYAQADVADYGTIERAIRNAEATFGKTACLIITNAGMADARTFTEVEPAALLPRNRRQPEGHAQRHQGRGRRHDRRRVAVGYTASKYAVRATSESLREAVGMQGVRVINVAPAYIRTNIHQGMGINFEEYCRLLGNPDFLSAEAPAEVVLYCWKLPPSVAAPTRSGF